MLDDDGNGINGGIMQITKQTHVTNLTMFTSAQGHREFPFWKRKIPPAKEKIPENSRSVKCLILHALAQ